MGCSPSKDTIKGPSKDSKKTSSWDKGIHRRFTIQINRSLKATDGSYIAAIFSAYGVIRKHVPFKALEAKVSTRKALQREDYMISTRSVEVASVSNQHTNFAACTVVGVPVTSTKDACEMLGAQKSTKILMENLEPINVQELMEGLDDEGVFSNLESCQGFSNLSIQVHEQERSTLAPIYPTEEHTPEPLSTNKSAKRSRPKSFSSISPVRSIEDVDVALPARNSRTSLCLQRSRPKSFSAISSIRTTEDVNAALSAREAITCSLSKSSRESWQQEEGAYWPEYAQGTECLLSENTPNTISDSGNAMENDDYAIWVPACESPNSTVDGDDPSLLNSDNLQRVLSFKYMFENCSKENPMNPWPTNAGEPNSSLGRSDSLVFSTAWSSYDTEIYGFPSSPRLSPFSTHSSKDLDDPDTLVSQCEDEPPVFDPEMVEFFENAIRHLSREEWYAVRSMEESPANSQSLVKTLKKSSSNSRSTLKEPGSALHLSALLQANKKARIGTEDGLEPHSKLDGEKKRALRRQNSLEMGKAFSTVSSQDDKDRSGVVFYSTTIRDGSKTFEDCERVRSILRSIVGILYDERSISELEEHEKELMHGLNVSVLIVPTLYLQGKYVVGIESILELYKKGKLGFMMKEAVASNSIATLQCGCKDSKLIFCTSCNDSRKVSGGEEVVLCRQCTSSGLI